MERTNLPAIFTGIVSAGFGDIHICRRTYINTSFLNPLMGIQIIAYLRSVITSLKEVINCMFHEILYKTETNMLLGLLMLDGIYSFCYNQIARHLKNSRRLPFEVRVWEGK